MEFKKKKKEPEKIKLDEYGLSEEKKKEKKYPRGGWHGRQSPRTYTEEINDLMKE